jgi:hypothetical protein
LWIYLALLANVVLFFHKPLFNSEYLFPWDFRGVQLPPITFLADELRQGRFALWNPYVYNGFPVFANIEACYFHPLVLASAFLAAHTSLDALPMLLEWITVIQIWLGAIAFFHVLRKLGTGTPAAFAGAIIFETGGFFASRAQHIVSMMSVAWMPLAWLAVLHLAEGGRRRWLAVLSFALGMSILGGFPQASLTVFVSVVLAGWMTKSLQRVLPGCVLGVLLAAVIFLPTTQLTEHSVAKYRADWLGTGGGLHPGALLTLLIPNYFHIFNTSEFKGPGDLTFLYMYCSLAGLALAIYALVVVRHKFFVVMAAVGIFWMLGDQDPVWRWLYPLIPEKIRIGIHPEYAFCLLIFGVAGLAALGLDRLRMQSAFKWAVAVLIALDLYLVGANRPMNVASVKAEPGVTRDAFDGSRALLEGVRSRVRQDTPPSRVDTVDAGMFWSIAGATTGVPSANGVSPLAPEFIIQLRLFLHDGARWGWYYPLEKLDSPVLDLLNTRWVITSPKAADRLRAVPRFRHVASLPGNELFENSTVLPRFFLVHQVRVGAPLNEIDVRTTALVESPIALPPGNQAENSVKSVEYSPKNVEIDVKSAGVGLLVASETYYPGWEAWVDDQPVPIHRVDLGLRGIVVPDGAHRVRMEFHPVILWVGLAISLLTAAALAGIWVRK